MNPKVSIIILNWNGLKDTTECLESLKKITYPNYEVIVVDNGSEGNDADILEKKYKDYIKLIRNKENLGFAGGNNIALRYALKREFPLMLLLNNDTVVEPLFLTLLVKTLELHRNWIAVGPKILYKEDPKRIWYAGAALRVWRANCVHIGINQMDGNRWKGMHPTEFVSGCCFLARRQLFEAVGLLDEDFFFGDEDWACSCVLRAKGLKLGVNLNAKIFHKLGGSLERGNPIYAYYYNKNRLLILRKYGSLTEKFLGYSFYAISRLPKFSRLLGKGDLRLIRSELKAIHDFLLGRYGDYDRKQVNSHV